MKLYLFKDTLKFELDEALFFWWVFTYAVPLNFGLVSIESPKQLCFSSGDATNTFFPLSLSLESVVTIVVAVHVKPFNFKRVFDLKIRVSRKLREFCIHTRNFSYQTMNCCCDGECLIWIPIERRCLSFKCLRYTDPAKDRNQTEWVLSDDDDGDDECHSRGVEHEEH